MGRLSEIWACPACQGTLAPSPAAGAEAGGPACTSCGARYPLLGAISVLLPSAAHVLARWRSGLQAFSDETEGAERHLLAELVKPGLTDATRRRLRSVAEAMPEQRRQVLELFEEVGLTPAPGRDKNAPSLLDYLTLIHRDFAWSPEVDEITPALDQLERALPKPFRLGKTLVLGAGTGRLAWDLALHFPSTEPIVALDLNPLPLLVTQRLLAGQPALLFELPGHPKDAQRAAVLRTLRAPGPPPPNLELLIADGLRPPFASGAFDTVVTPWFLDQVPQDLAAFLPELRRLLAPGGSWLHTGPFVYAPSHTRPVHRYGPDEFLELVAKAGFEVTSAGGETATYLCSPLSTQGRKEWVFCMHATKRELQATTGEPPWLAPDSQLAVPQLALGKLASLPLPILERVASLIDGQRNAADLTRELLAEGALADDGNAEVAVRGCLRVLWKLTKSAG